MDTKTIFISGLFIAVLASGCLNASSTKPAWAHDVNWQGDISESTEDIETKLWTKIAPYNTEYDFVNITVKNEGNRLRLRVVGISNVIEYPDVYDFTYSEGTLTRTGYLLEAITSQDRDAAIAVAMQDKDFRTASAAGVPTVRRILPDTSKKYYAPKTLISLTWQGVSVLVDPEERKIANIWKESGSEK